MKIFKRMFAIGILCATITSLSTPVFANTLEEATSAPTTTQGTIVLRDVNLIEDNGEAYVEIIITDDQISSRASGSYSTTYDMKGGVFTQQSWKCTSAPTFTVYVSPTSFAGTEYGVDGYMTVFLERKTGLGWDSVDADKTSLISDGKVILEGSQSGTYRLYFNSISGYRATGDIEIEYEY